MKLNSLIDFEDFADYYSVCRDGDRCWVIGRGGRVLKASYVKGYLRIGLILSSGKQKMIYQHRLFAMCFIPNPENKSQIDHLDGCKSNNLLSNLEWVNPDTNIQRAYDKGLAKSGEKHGRAKISKSDLQIIFNLKKQALSQRSIAKQMGISQAQISRIISGKSRKSETKLNQNLYSNSNHEQP